MMRSDDDESNHVVKDHYAAKNNHSALEGNG